MNKLIAAVMVGCLAASASFGRSFSVDLRQPSATTCVRAAAKLKAVSSVAGGQEFLRRVNLDVGSADVGKVAVGDELAFTLFDDVAIALTLEKQMPSLLGGDVFLAEASGYEGVKNAVVICTEDGLTVDIQDYLNKKVYKVISTSAGVSVQEMEAKGGRCGCDAREPSTRAGTASAKPQKAKNVVASKNVDPDETCVDILVAYDKNAATWANDNGGGVTNFAQMAVQKMNTVLVNNGLDWYFRFRLVGVMCVAASSADLDYALDAATDGYSGWDSIRATRDEVGADIVTVLIDTGTDTGTTGLGWSLEADNFGSFSECAYNCCAIRSVAQSHTMTHEVGHNMGAGHSDVQETQPGPQLYSYSAGYYFSADDEKCHTIMAYDGEGPGGIEVPYFSSPYSYYKDVAVGDDTHDNRWTLANTCEAVSKWREAKGIDIGGGDDVPTAPLEWLTSRDEVFAKAKAEGKNVFLICGRDTCSNTMGTRNYSCEDPSVKRYLLKDYVCWYNVIDTQYEEAAKYFDGYDVGMTLPSIAIIDVEKDETLVAGGGYHTVTDLRVMLGRVAKEVSFSPESGSRFRDSVEVMLSAASGSAIYYTLDGSDPSAGSSICYDMPITLTETTTIRAITFVDGVWGLPIDAEFSKSRTETSGGYEWTANVVDGGCVIVSVTPEPSGDIVMPAEIEGLDVIGFDAELFKWKKNLTTLAIPGSVVEIPEFAFESCEKLSAVTIGAGVERIGAYAFGWTGLETISIPASVTNIGVRAFTGCYDMTAIAVDPANEYYSSKDGFMYDKTLKHLLYCPGALRYVEIPQGVTHLGEGAFSDSNVERVVIPKSVEEIGESAFVWCDQLKEVAIPESVTNIGYSAFDYCWAPLADAYLPKHLESDSIQADSFDTHFVDMEVTMHYYSGALKQVAVYFDANGGELENPNQKLEIADNKIVVPFVLPVPMRTGHEFLGWFTATNGGTQVTMDAAITDGMTLYAHWEKINYTYNYIDNGDGTVTLSGWDKDGSRIDNPIVPAPVGKFVVPDEIDGKRVVAIEDGFFHGGYYGYEITSLVIPSSVTNMTVDAVAYMHALNEIIIAGDNPTYMDIEGVLYTKDGKKLVAYPRGKGGDVVVVAGTECIGKAAFQDYGNLNSVLFPVGLKSIEELAFCGCGGGWGDFTSVTIPSSVESIGSWAFSDCENLENVIFEGDESLISIDDTAFVRTPYDAAKPFALIVDEYGVLVGIHGVAPKNLVIADHLDGKTLTGIDYQALSSWTYDTTGLTHVVIPEGVTYIESYAFAADDALEGVTLPASLQRVEYDAFYNCTALREIMLPAGVEYVSAYAFEGCTNLTVHAPSTLRDAFSVPDGSMIEYYEVYRCAVTFDANGGMFAGGKTAVWTVYEGRRLDSADEYHDYYDLPAPTLDGYKFLGWFTSAKGGTQVTMDTVVSGDVTYYAQWIERLHWHTDSASALAEAKSTGRLIFFLSGRETCANTIGTRDYTCEEPEVRAVLGEYVLWFCNCDTQWRDLNQYVSGSGSIVLPYVCVINPYTNIPLVRSEGYLDAGGVFSLLAAAGLAPGLKTVVFDANGGIVSEMERTVQPGSAVGALPTPTREDHKFLGWFTAMEGGTRVTASANVTVDVTYYAHWVQNGGGQDGGKSQNSMHDLYGAVYGIVSSTAASEYNGYLYDEKSGAVKGTIQVKVGKPGKKDGKASVKATVVIGTKKVTLKGAEKGKAVLSADGLTEIELVGGEACEIALGSEGLTGYYGSCLIDGSRDFFASKDKGEVSAANAILAKWLGSFMVIWDGGSLSVNIAAKGKVKVSGTLADGKTKVSVSTVLLVGEEWSCVSVAAQKANLAFVLWLSHDGQTIEVEGLGDNVLVGLPGTLANGAAFQIDADELAAVFGQAMLPYLPDGVPVTQKGTKWTLPKAGKVVYKNGAPDESKLGDNPCGLKLTYKSKDGTFKGSFKVYAEVKGKPKATTVNVTGFMLNGVGYGTATIKGKGSVAVTIE